MAEEEEEEREADQTTVRFSQTWLGTKLGRWPCESPGFVFFSLAPQLKIRALTIADL